MAGRGGKEIFLTNSVAIQKILRKIFKEKGFTLLDVPSKMHLQLLVTNGTGLSL